MPISTHDPVPRGDGSRRRAVSRFAGAGLVLAIAVAPALTAVSAAAAEGTVRAKYALASDVDSLNPFLQVFGVTDAMMTYQYEPLVTWSPEDNTEFPAIAETWEVSEDAKTWTFHLEEGAKWSDGEPIVAEDVKWTVEAIQQNDALKTARGSLVENIAKVEAPDETTVIYRMAEPQAPNPGTDLPIVPSHIWSKLDDPAEFKNDRDTVGSGPFIITEYAKSSGVTMVSNPNYRHGQAKIDDLIFVPYKNADAAVQALKSGEVDLVDDMTVAQFKSLQNVEGVSAISGTGKGFSAMAINPGAKDIDGNDLGNGNPVLQDTVVRQAIVRAIDNETMRKRVLEGLAVPGTGTVPPLYPRFFWKVDPVDLPLAYDPEAANKLLDDAGYEKGADGVRLDKSGNPISLRLMGRSSSSAHQQNADFVVPWLKEIGIDVKVNMLSDSQVNDESVLGNYDMYFTGWNVGPDPDFILSINLCSSRPNADGTGATSESNWCDPEFDELYAQQRSETDEAKRADIILEMQKIKYNAAVNNIMYYADRFQAYRSDRFTGAQMQPADGGVLMRQNGPWGVYSLTPVEGAASGGSGDVAASGGSATWWVVGGIAAVVVIGSGIVLSRRRSQADDRE